MKRRRRFSYEQLRTLWTLWKDGHTLPEIQAALGCRSRASSAPRDTTTPTKRVAPPAPVAYSLRLQ